MLGSVILVLVLQLWLVEIADASVLSGNAVEKVERVDSVSLQNNSLDTPYYFVQTRRQTKKTYLPSKKKKTMLAVVMDANHGSRTAPI